MSTPQTGYDFVPLPPQVRREPRRYASLQQRMDKALFGRIDVVLRAEQPVHVGSGSKVVDAGKVIQRGVLVRGRPGILGSSLKGVLRSRYEAVTRSCVLLGSLRYNNVQSRSNKHIKHARLARNMPERPLLDAKERGSKEHGCTKDRKCPACALFGRMSLRSRLTVTDLVCSEQGEYDVKPIPPRYSPRPHYVGEYKIVSEKDRDIFELQSLYGRKFAAGRGPVDAKAPRQWIEVISEEQTVRGQIRLFNIQPAELGGLLVALGRAPSSTLAVGGGKAHGFGRMRCIRLDYHLQNADGTPEDADEAAWRAAFMDSPDRWDKGEQALVSLHGGEP